MDDQGARFTRFYKLFYPRVLAYARRRVPPDQAHEVTDETFLIAWRRRHQLPEAVLPWLLVTARNVISEQLRKGQRQDALALEIARCTEAIAEAGTEAGADVIAIERLTVLTALSQLTASDRDALMLTVWDGLTNRQAAVIAGCSTTAFALRLHRARRRLATVLEQLDTSPPSSDGRNDAPAEQVSEVHVLPSTAGGKRTTNLDRAVERRQQT